MHYFATYSLFKRSKRIPHLALVVFLSGCLWQVFYSEECCCCGCPINDSMPRIRWKERQRERCLCLDVRGELSIYNSLSCLTGWVLMWWMLFQSGEDSVFLNLGSLRPLWAWTTLSNVLLWSFDPYTGLLENCDTAHTHIHTQLHQDNWQLAPVFTLAAQQGVYNNSPLTPAQSTCHQ